ncbi:hypothetical protein CMO93_02880 [Candidatus Woesearchaeota archaeon]|nr:hypothetical protein [Candidatus Woesearchaeota archaeon]|tara:strand:+ start:7549 stop:8100 length:552 start_codon:yes stop_codon:yes gene_type:complete
MNELVKKDALGILNKVIEILNVKEEKDITEIKELSDHTIHNASVFQDYCSVSIAVVIYALSKVIERKQYGNYQNILKILGKVRKSLINDEEQDFKSAIKQLFSEISRIDSKLKIYMQEVISQAEVKKGSKLYQHGLSAAKASHVMGVSQWELMNYLGNIKPDEAISAVTDVRARLKFTRSLFS